MDDKTFDSLAKLSVTSAGRRRLLQSVAAAGFGGLLAQGAAGAQGVVAEACQDRQTKCNRDRQCECNRGDEFKNVVCDPLPNKCDKRGDRCCGRAKATCKKDCDCCRGYQCNSKKECVRS